MSAGEAVSGGRAAAAPAPPGEGGERVVVCVATYRRPALAALLQSLAALELPNGERVSLVVVDNDAAQSARPVVEAAGARSPHPVQYVVEPERNIALARNRGVARALELGAAWVAFVDDDEVVAPEWLRELLAAGRRFAADAVCGDVVPRFAPGAPAWAARSGLFAQRHRRAGERLKVAATNNALVAAALLAGPRPFDPDFGLTGSSDSLFFAAAARRGARVVAAPAARVAEDVPPERTRAGWLLRRAFRYGNAAVYCERALPPEHRQPVRRVAKATLRLAASAALLAPAALLGRAGILRALWGVCYGAGCWAAVAGYRFAEYRELDR